MKDYILLVEDEDSIRLSLKTRLTSAGFNADVAVDGVEAIEKLKQHEFDVVMLDIHLPRMDGLEALEIINKQFPRTDVIMLTGFADFNTAIECLKAGAKDYLIKPVHPIELVSRLKAIFRERASRKSLYELQARYTSAVLGDFLLPLSSVSSTLDYLIKGKAGQINKDQAMLLSYIRKTVNLVGTRVNETVDLSSFQNGVIKINRTSTDISALVEPVAMRYEILSRSKGLKLFKSIEKNLSPVNCDSEKLVQVLNSVLDYVLNNLLSGGSLTVSLKKDKKKLQSVERECALIEISDNGIIVPADLIPTSFQHTKELFANKKVDTLVPGIAMAISKYIVESHGGEFWLKSDSNSGNTFSIAIPFS